MKNFIFPILLIIGFVNLTISQTVTIGIQVWMTKNLDVEKFRNGDAIPEAKTNEEWEKAGKNGQPAWCHYENDSANGAEYGKLYNWYAVNDLRGLAPKGYHIPTDAEWKKLTDFLGGENVAGTNMKNTSGWGGNGNGTNTSGFSCLPGGFRYHTGIFYDIGYNGFWWSSTEDDASIAWYRNLIFDIGNVGRYYDAKQDGFSVRCLMD